MKKILVVEDDAAMAALLRTFLVSKQLEVSVAVDGLDALEKIKASVPDLVLLDVMMPRLDGYGFIRELKKDAKLRSLPVVVLTSSAQDEDVLRSYRNGANSYVRKPVELDAFIKALAQLQLYWMVLNVNPQTVT